MKLTVCDICGSTIKRRTDSIIVQVYIGKWESEYITYDICKNEKCVKNMHKKILEVLERLEK